MSERNIYQEPKDRVLLRTADVYQTEVADDVTSYSDRLLSIVADFRNSGMPDGSNAQSMVGKSKRGEVACRLFARIDPQTGIIEAAGFKSRGCLAMTGCASAICGAIEGKGIEEALTITVEDVCNLVDGVPADKMHAAYFTVCAVRALVGDFLLKDGAMLTELDEAVPCDPLSIPCIMAEHCSLRQSRLECRMEEEAAANEIAQNNACAEVFDLIRQNTAHGVLTRPEDWKDLVPAHLMPDEFEKFVLAQLEDGSTDSDLVSSLSPDSVRAHTKPEAKENKPSRFANRGVGVPHFFEKKSLSDTEDTADTPEADGTNKPADSAHSTMPETIRALEYNNPTAEDDDFELVPPEGFELVEVDGTWGLVAVSESAKQGKRTIKANGIKILPGSTTTYLYDATVMKPAFARWAYLAQENDPLTTFAYCVREESRTYPRPMAEKSFSNHPFNMDANTVESIWAEIHTHPEYSDLCRTEASNGDVYYFSTDHLSADYARSLAEWESVERYMNV